MNGVVSGSLSGEVVLSMVSTTYLSMVLLTAGLGLLVAGVAVRYRSDNGALALGLFAGLASLLTLSHALVLARATVGEMAWLTQAGLSLAALVPAAWLVLVFRHTAVGHWSRFPWLALPFAAPLVFTGFVWTGPEALILQTAEPVPFGPYSLLAVEFGLLYWAYQLVATLYFVVGGLILGRILVRQHTAQRRQATAMLGAGVAVLVANALFSFGRFPAGLDPTGVVGVFASVLLVVVLFTSRLRSIAPAARAVGRETVVDELDDAIVLLDNGNRIIDANPAAEQLLDTADESFLGRPIETFRPEIAAAIEDEKERQELTLEQDGANRYYDLRATVLSDELGTLSGTVVSLRDITAQRQQRQRLDVLNRLLRHNIRNELNVVGGKIELAQLESETSSAEGYLSEAKAAVDTVVNRADKVGRLSRMLDTEQPAVIDIANELRTHADAGGFEADSAEVQLALPDSLSVRGGPPLLAAFEELVSNAVVHNDGSPQVAIVFEQSCSDEERAVITVRDNGPGIDEQEVQTILEGEETPLRHSSGVGLWLVNWVVTRAGGSLSFASADEETDERTEGSTVRLSLPRADP